MAHRVLFLIGRLAEGLLQVLAPEERIVPEPAAPGGFFENPAGTHPFEVLGNPAGFSIQRQDTAVARPAPRFGRSGEPAQQKGVVRRGNFGLRPLGQSPATRTHSRLAAQGEYLEPAVVRDGGESGLLGEVLGLGACVGGERVLQLEPLLLLGVVDPGVVGKDHFESAAGQQPPDLALLARAPGRRQQFHQPSAFRWRSKSREMPRWALSTTRSSSAREKVPCSPVPCTSTKASGARITTLASTPASLSSVYARSSSTAPSTITTESEATSAPNDEGCEVGSAS